MVDEKCVDIGCFEHCQVRKHKIIGIFFEGCQVVVWAGEKTVFFESLAVSKHAWLLRGFEGCQDKSSKTSGVCPSHRSSAMGRKCLGCEASSRERVRLDDTSRLGNKADGALPTHPSGGTPFGFPRRRGFLGVSTPPDTHSSPLLDESQNSYRRRPSITRAGSSVFLKAAKLWCGRGQKRCFLKVWL